MWNVSVGTLFPGIFPGPLGISCIGKALGKLWNLSVHDLREFATDVHKTVDDAPLGGGGGMIIKCEIVDKWFQRVVSESGNTNARRIYMSPRGKRFDQGCVKDLVAQDLCILCGRYEGVDVRVLQHWGVEEISIGDFVLHGGEVAAMALIEACARSIVVKDYSFANDSFSDGLLEHDQYTRPSEWRPWGIDKDESKSYNVPEVLISGHHAKIERWREENSKEVTKLRRPDLWQKYLEGKK